MQFPAPNPERAKEYHAAGYWCEETIPALIAKAAAKNPDKIAIKDNTGVEYSYLELMEKSACVAGFLRANGVGKGDVVTVCLPNRSDTIVAFLATLRIGGVVNPVPINYGPADLIYATNKCASRAMFISAQFQHADFISGFIEMDSRELDECAVVVLNGDPESGQTTWQTALDADPILQDSPMSADDPATVLFTSGTEAKAKGAVHSHNTILFGERALATALSIGPSDVTFMASPISHTTGFMHGFVLTLMTGGTLSLLDKFNGQVAAAQMAAHKCTWTMGATPFLAEISTASAKMNIDLPDMRFFLCGGAPIPEVLARKATDFGFRVLSIYGATESPPHTMVGLDDPVENAWLTDGRPFPAIEVRIVAEDGSNCPVGVVGEEWSRGPNTFLGYLGDPDLTSKTLDADGWVHSGDLARQWPDGSLRITGRLKEIIVRGGQNISVREVEDYLMAHPVIEQAAVVGVPHLRLGETGAAVVVTQDNVIVTLPELTTFLIERGIAKFKLPEELHIWDALPINPSGKIQKFIIRQKLAEKAKETQI